MKIFKAKAKDTARDFSIKSRNSLTGSSRSRDSVFQEDPTGRNTVRSTRRTASWYELHAKPVAFIGGFVIGWFISLAAVTGIGVVTAKWLSGIAVNNNLHTFDLWFQSTRKSRSMNQGMKINYLFP